MIYAVFTNDGATGLLSTEFYKTLNLSYKLDCKEAAKLLELRGVDSVFCNDTACEYIRVETYNNDAEFNEQMYLNFQEYWKAIEYSEDLKNEVRDIMDKLEKGVASRQEILDNYNHFIADDAEDLKIFFSMDDLLYFMYKN